MLCRLLTALLLVGLLSAAAPAPSVFKSYQDALNRHDAAAVAAYWALTGPEAQQKVTTDVWRGYREFERATHAVFTIEAKALGDDAFEITQREDCDFYAVLETGTKTSTFQVKLRDGKFHEARGGTTVDSGRPYGPTLDDFQAWVRKVHPEHADEILSDGDFVFNASTAETIMQLARKWRASSR
ncbi:MAG TPA: hypothetical protein VJS12_07235 [Steroidobacteraceae bacterium]|nr:hypothetical protein [Steroidobacteraceae bacterium]